MAPADLERSSAEPVAEVPQRSRNVWFLFGSVLFVLAFLLGWRSHAGTTPPGDATRARVLPE